MVDLNDLIVCSVCHADLPLSILDGQSEVGCPACGRRYAVDRGVLDMTPLPPPNEFLISRWSSWQKLQDNGMLSYTSAPEFNLSIGNRKDACAFRDFSKPSGLILDIGCGPQVRPTYLPEGGAVVGIDPLVGEQPRAFSFVQGIGEYLPFRDETFDQILYASSLDHIIDPERSLAEAKRCLKRDGRICIWIDGLGSSISAGRPSTRKKHQTRAKKGMKSLLRHNWLSEIGLSRTLSYIGVVARMTVPEGASDCFHFAQLNAGEVFGWLIQLNLNITRQQDYPEADSVFVEAMK
jgi:SAM-dependent methyltransferase